MLRGTPASFFVMAAGVPLGVLLAWAELRLPALVVSEVTGGQTFLHAALAVGALLVLTFLAVGLRASARPSWRPRRAATAFV